MWSDLDIIERYESKWLDPDYDIYTRRYRSAREEDERDTPLSEEESWEEEQMILEHIKETIRKARTA